MGKISAYHYRGLQAFAFFLLVHAIVGPTEDHGIVRAELVTVLTILASVAISALASLLLQPEIPSAKSPIKDTKPTTLAARGSFIPVLIGRRRIGPLFAYAGNRDTETSTTGGGGKGGGGGPGGETTIYYEDGVHVLCIGPAFKLHNIWVDGQNIFSGGIDQHSHPSGSDFDLDNGDTIEIYWGDGNGPTSSFIDNAIGVLSKWPYICMVIWRPKKLGTVARWPSTEYEVECRPLTSDLSTTAWINGALTDTALVKAVTSNSDGGPGLGFLRVSGGDYTSDFKPGKFFRLAGNAMDDGVYEVFNSDYNSGTNNTRIYLVEPVEGSNTAGTITLLSEANTNGVNYAHVIHQVLFGTYPHGVSPEREDFDLNSLSQLGELLEGEGLCASVIAKDGEIVKGIMAALLQDCGVFISLDPSTGLYRFVPIRAPNSPDDIVPLPDDANVGSVPEFAMDHGERNADRIQFEFSDQKKLFRDMTVTYDDDGQASALDYKKIQRVRIVTSTSYPTVKKIGGRRAQEELSTATATKFSGNHAIRRLYPGRLVSVTDLDEALRITSMSPITLSAKVEIEAITDFYGVPPSSLDQADDEADEEPPVETIPISLSSPDWDWFEVPRSLSPMMPRIFALARRTDPTVTQHLVHVSLDGSTYTQVGRILSHAAGGVLDEALDADSNFEIEEGPSFTSASEDMHQVLDLTGDLEGWRAGKQWLLIGSEICFLRGVTAIGGDTYRLDGILRARFDTVREAHLIGASIYIIQADRILMLASPLLVPDRDLHVKVQSVFGSVLEDISSIAAKTRELIGKGVAPSMPTSLRAGRNKGQPDSYVAGGNVELKWDYLTTSNFVGAGATLAGNTWERAKPEGVFTVETWDAADTILVSSRDVSGESEFLYENADLVTDHGGEPSSFIVKVFETFNNYVSPVSQITVTKV